MVLYRNSFDLHTDIRFFSHTIHQESGFSEDSKKMQFYQENTAMPFLRYFPPLLDESSFRG